MTYMVNQWLFCSYEFGQITDMEGDRVTGFTTGTFRTGSHDLSDRCFPLTMEVKRLSEVFAYESARLHREGASGLNYPRMHDWLVDHWCHACVAVDPKRQQELVKEASDFVTQMLKLQDLETGYGFPLFRLGVKR